MKQQEILEGNKLIAEAVTYGALRRRGLEEQMLN